MFPLALRALFLSLLLALLAAAPAAADITVSNVHAAPASALAGGHSDFTVSFDLGGSETIRDLDVNLPPGLVGNPNAASQCSVADFNLGNCPASSQVGTSSAVATAFIQTTASGEIYNLVPNPGEPARLGIHLSALGGLAGDYYLQSPVGLRTTTDYGLTSTVRDMPNQTLGAIPLTINSISLTLDATTANGRFMTNPTSCGQATTQLRVVGYGDSVATGSASFTPSDCAGVPFTPTVSVLPGTTKVDTPSSYDISLLVPGAEDPRRQSHVRRVEIALPQGTGLNAPLGQGLEGCSDAQFGIGSPGEPSCPAASNVGTAQIDTPVLGVLNGQVYLAAPTPADPYRVFVAIDGPGLVIKLAGKVSPDPATGRVTSVFDGLPQVPFTRFTLSFRGGDRAVLVNGLTCGPQQTDARLTPWSGGADATPASAFTTTSDGQGGGCPAPQPFAPTLAVSSTDHTAGAGPHVTMDIARAPGQQLLRDLQLSLPSGLVGGVSGIGLCVGDAAETGNCPPESRVGSATAISGAGGDPLRLSGGLFLSTGTDGAAASLLSVIPARVGPFDFGNAIVRSNIHVRPSDSGFDVSAANLPTILGGIPLRLRGLSLTLDRDGFMRNPTACGDSAIGASFTSVGGAVATASAPYSVTGCDSLPFAPKIEATVGSRGTTALKKHPPLTTVVTQQPGEAATHSATVTLPGVIRPNLDALGNLCHVADYLADTCPAASIVGQATAVTPLLPLPLSGPVRVVEHPGGLPQLVVYLNGLINLRLVGDVIPDSHSTSNVFAGIPDVPLSRFELAFPGGSKGLVFNTRNLCAGAVRLTGRFESYSGKTATTATNAAVQGCRQTPSATVSASGLAGSAPALRAAVRRGADGRGLHALRLTLPHGLSFDRGRLRAGVRATAGGKRLARGISFAGTRALTLSGLRRSGVDTISLAVGNGALRASPALRRAARRHPKLSFTLRVTDAGGRATTLKKTVRAR